MTKTGDSQYYKAKPATLYKIVIVISVSLAMLAVGGSRGIFGVFFIPLADDLGWSSAAMSGTFSLSLIIEGMMSLVSGKLADKFGTRIVLILSGIISGSGFILMSQVSEIWQMYLIYGLAMGVGIGGIVVPVVSFLSRSFTSRRALMTGISLAAVGLGQLVSPVISYRLIETFNWRLSYIILGIAVFMLITLPALLLKNDNHAKVTVSQKASLSSDQLIKLQADEISLNEAVRTRLFWMLVIMFSLYGYFFSALIVHTVPYAVNIGIDGSTASGILALIGGSILVGRLFFGNIADKIGNKKTIMIGFIMSSISLLWLIQADQTWELIIFAAVCGSGMGAISSPQSPLTAEYFGVKSLGSIYGAIGGSSALVGALGPFFTGYLFDTTGHYQTAFIICASLSLAGLAINLRLRYMKKMPESFP